MSLRFDELSKSATAALARGCGRIDAADGEPAPVRDAPQTIVRRGGTSVHSVGRAAPWMPTIPSTHRPHKGISNTSSAGSSFSVSSHRNRSASRAVIQQRKIEYWMRWP